jgi:hypothetical protein
MFIQIILLKFILLFVFILLITFNLLAPEFYI